MMHGREKSDLAIVAMKPANKANEPTAEASTGAKGNAHQQSTHWTQSQARVSQALERIRQAIAVIHPRWEPYAGKPPVRFCAGGTMKIASLPLQRPEFITRFGGAVAWPLAARAQQVGKLPTIGYLGADASAFSPWTAAFVAHLRELGWIENRNIAIEYRWSEGRTERYAEIAAEFVRLKVDVIVTVGSAVPTVVQVTTAIPIVLRWQSTRWAMAWSQV